MTARSVPDDRLRPLMAPDGVHVWAVHERPRPADRAVRLSVADRARLGTMRPAGADRLLARRAVLRAAVAALAGCPPDLLETGADGPRSIRSPDGRTWFVSGSSSGDHGLLAVADVPVGVDLERLPAPPDALLVSSHLLAPAEHAWISRGRVTGDVVPGHLGADAGTQGHPDPVGHRFLATWVRKEAVVKCTGEGLSRDLRSFVVDAGRAEAEVVDDAGRPLGLRTHGLTLPGHVAALARAQPTGITWSSGSHAFHGARPGRS